MEQNHTTPDPFSQEKTDKTLGDSLESTTSVTDAESARAFAQADLGVAATAQAVQEPRPVRYVFKQPPQIPLVADVLVSGA